VDNQTHMIEVSNNFSSSDWPRDTNVHLRGVNSDNSTNCRPVGRKSRESTGVQVITPLHLQSSKSCWKPQSYVFDCPLRLHGTFNGFT
jgi:hypothetical protein